MYITVFVTVPSMEVGKKIAGALLEDRLAACVNIHREITSMYWWKEKIQEEPESLLIIKTKLALFEALEKKVKENHPYEVPEVIALPIVTGSKPYIQWLCDETLATKDDQDYRGMQF